MTTIAFGGRSRSAVPRIAARVQASPSSCPRLPGGFVFRSRRAWVSLAAARSGSGMRAMVASSRLKACLLRRVPGLWMVWWLVGKKRGAALLGSSGLPRAGLDEAGRSLRAGGPVGVDVRREDAPVRVALEGWLTAAPAPERVRDTRIAKHPGQLGVA